MPCFYGIVDGKSKDKKPLWRFRTKREQTVFVGVRKELHNGRLKIWKKTSV
jgi:predicted RNA-binding protein YlxR (DUF448 family)